MVINNSEVIVLTYSQKCLCVSFNDIAERSCCTIKRSHTGAILRDIMVEQTILSTTHSKTESLDSETPALYLGGC